MAASTPCPTNRALASILIFKRDPAERYREVYYGEYNFFLRRRAPVHHGRHGCTGILLQRFKVFKTLGPALTVIVMGIVMSNLRIVPTSSPTYDAISSYCVPLSVSICLLSLDLKQMRKLSKEPIIALASAIFSVCVAALVFGILFANKIDEGWKVAGMFVGTYTGGSSNLTAIAVGLDASKNTIASANAADYVVGIPTLILMFATPALYKSSKWLKKLWPYDMSESELLGDGNHEELMASKEWSIQEIAWLLAIGFGTVWAATSISSMVFGEGFRSAGRILLITTFSIILAQVPAVRKLRGNFDLGLFIAVLFLVTIGFAVDLKQFFGSTFYITLFCFCVIACSILLHLLITRLLKVRLSMCCCPSWAVSRMAPPPPSSPPAPSGRPLSTSACSWAYWPVPWATMWASV